MDKALLKYYEDQFSMLASDAWKELTKDLMDLVNNYSDIRNCDNNDMLQFRKGQLDILDFILNRKQFLEKGYEELTDDKTNI
jgi:hypothetical protein